MTKDEFLAGCLFKVKGVETRYQYVNPVLIDFIKYIQEVTDNGTKHYHAEVLSINDDTIHVGSLVLGKPVYIEVKLSDFELCT